MSHGWGQAEMDGLDLGDQRLNRRAVKVLEALASHPTASVPAACGGYAETAAAYRLIENPQVTMQGLLEPHIAATRRRLAEQATAIVPGDTTEIDLTRPEQQVVGAGPLDGGSRRGVLLHSVVAFTPEGTPLGMLHCEVLNRPDRLAEEKPAGQAQAARQRKHTPIEQKESYRWITSLRAVQEEARRAEQTHVVHVADSEADIFELLAEATQGPPNFDWIVRACQDRTLAGTAENPPENNEVLARLGEQLAAQPVLYAETIEVRGRSAKVACEDRGRRQPRQSRTAQVEVRAARVTLRAPWRPDRKLPDVTVNVVWVREVDPPPGEPAVEWMLLTSLPIETVEQVRQIVTFYRVRWMIEIFFRTLKSGCKVEKRRFEQIDRELTCLGLYLIVAWRTLFVCRLARELPEVSCEVIFEPAEWKSLHQVIHHKPPPQRPPTLREMVRQVAQLGGYINRARPDEPGPQTVWLGLQRLYDITCCWYTFGPGRSEVALV